MTTHTTQVYRPFGDMAQFGATLYSILIFAAVTSEIKAQEISGPCTSTGSRCIDSCANSDGHPLEDGNYQWCESCRSFVQCSNGILYLQKCGTNQVWHDLFKACLAQSTTCVECVDYKPPDSHTTARPECPVTPIARLCTSTGPVCIESCAGVNQGNYQWCGRCDYFIQCVGGETTYTACQSGLVYDHGLLRCEYESNSCQCIVKFNRLEPHVSTILGLFSRPNDPLPGVRFYFGYLSGRTDEEGWSECEARCANEPLCNSYTFISNYIPNNATWMGECLGTNDEQGVRVEDPYSFSGLRDVYCASSTPVCFDRLEPRVSTILGLFDRPSDAEPGKRFYFGYLLGKTDEEGWIDCEARCNQEPLCNSYTFISNYIPNNVTWMGECMGTNDEHAVRVEDPYSFSGVRKVDCSSSAPDANKPKQLPGP